MISFKKTQLSNGLTVIVHEDPSTPLAAVNILYDVGARDEDPNRTGFAHLFEHLMFGGRKIFRLRRAASN
jgi:predicted Zn-dependent peptidase